MELVATSKLRRAKIKAETTRPFFEVLQDTLDEIKRNTRDFSSDFTKKREVKNTCVVVIGGDRGLAGGYNYNVFKKADEIIKEGDCIVLPVGKKATEHYQKLSVKMITEEYSEADDVNISHCYAIGRMLSEKFKKGIFDRLVIVYTKFISMLSQEAVSEEILPFITAEKKGTPNKQLTLYEPSAEAVFEKIVPQYVSGVMYAAICESLASEHAARRTSMESASKNAAEMIDDLTLKYNRARQAAITQEITEIVSGAETM